ncbi:MAG: hypothetical protein DWQ31_02595 [Planctomycetota bacterium]|nr:MAG: hypothetical protein DWQ31_02595 [Planctomycetota bacterium]
MHSGRRLITVEDTVFVEGHGVALIPGLVPEGDENFQSGDAIELRLPNGNETRTHIASLQVPIPNPNHEVVVMLPREFGEEDVPIGTEVWSV